MADPLNRQIADRLEEAAGLLRDQGADPYRVGAYLRAADTVRHWPISVRQVYLHRGIEGLEGMPGVGPAIARALRELVTRGRLPMIDRLRGELDPETVLASVPGVGPRLAARLHAELGIETLEGLEAAAHDGRLETIAGFGAKRLAGIRDSLAHRLGRVRAAEAPHSAAPSVSELLAVDREYREKAEAGALPLIAPRRFNPTGAAWLPVLHTTRGPRRYTALFSNTAHAHRAGRTRDWVVLYVDDDAGERQYTVITATRGAHSGHRIVAGREHESVISASTAA
jgi:DNA polymerase (family X)